MGAFAVFTPDVSDMDNVHPSELPLEVVAFSQHIDIKKTDRAVIGTHGPRYKAREGRWIPGISAEIRARVRGNEADSGEAIPLQLSVVGDEH